MSITIPKVVKEYAKAVAVFVVGILTNMLLDLVNGEKPWPQDANEWRQYVLTSVGASLAALLVRNKITQKQLDKDPNVVGGTVVDDAQGIPGPTGTVVDGDINIVDGPKPTPGLGGYQNPWQ